MVDFFIKKYTLNCKTNEKNKYLLLIIFLKNPIVDFYNKIFYLIIINKIYKK